MRRVIIRPQCLPLILAVLIYCPFATMPKPEFTFTCKHLSPTGGCTNPDKAVNPKTGERIVIETPDIVGQLWTCGLQIKNKPLSQRACRGYEVKKEKKPKRPLRRGAW